MGQNRIFEYCGKNTKFADSCLPFSVLFIFIMLFNVKMNNILKLFSTDFILRKRVIGFDDVNLILIMIMTRSLYTMSYNALYDIKALSTKKPNPTPTLTQTEIKFSY